MAAQASPRFILCPQCGRASHQDGELVHCAACGTFKSQPPSHPPIEAPPPLLRDVDRATAAQCPHCHCKVAFVEELAGTSVGCPACGGKFVMNGAENDASSDQGRIIHGLQRRNAWNRHGRKKNLELLVGASLAVAGLLAIIGLVIFFNKSSVQIQRSIKTNSEDAASVALGFLILGVLALVYLMPTFVAIIRKHHNAAAIVILNVLTGWSFVGWVAALVWSFTEVRTKDHYHFHQYGPPPSNH